MKLKPLADRVIVKLVEGAEQRNQDRPFRLPVDRVFLVDGFGTVVTGTLIEGSSPSVPAAWWTARSSLCPGRWATMSSPASTPAPRSSWTARRSPSSARTTFWPSWSKFPHNKISGA